MRSRRARCSGWIAEEHAVALPGETPVVVAGDVDAVDVPGTDHRAVWEALAPPAR